MEYGYKITTNGQAAVMAALDLGRSLRITRAAVGSGTVEEGTDLAGVHTLRAYAAEAAIVGRRHERNRLFLTVQYANRDCQEAFTIGEFMVYAADPETGQETDFLYATLGNYRQPVPPYMRGVPSGVWEFPLIVATSEQLRLEITASPGLITGADLQEAIDNLKREIMLNALTFPLAAASGEELLTASGTPLLAVYHPNQNAAALAAVEALEGRMEAADAAVRAYADNTGRKAVTQANAYTAGKVLDLTGEINTAKAEAVSAAGTAADVKIAAHNDAPASHPLFLRAAENTGLAAPDPGGIFQNGDLNGPQTIPDL